MTEEVKSGFDRSLQKLKNKVNSLEGILENAERRIDRLKRSGLRANKTYALVDRQRCTGCGLCQRSCPTGAITVSSVAHVDKSKCVGCGICVESCPRGAIRLIS
jgi:ferredoxin